MTDYDRFSDEYDPEPDYDRPTRAEAAADMAEGPSEGRDDAWVRARYQETCEDRDYACCNLTPPGEDPDEGWYDRHLEAWLAQGQPRAEYTGSTCPVCGADIPPHAPDCPAGQAEQPDDIGEDF